MRLMRLTLTVPNIQCARCREGGTQPDEEAGAYGSRRPSSVISAGGVPNQFRNFAIYSPKSPSGYRSAS